MPDNLPTPPPTDVDKADTWQSGRKLYVQTTLQGLLLAVPYIGATLERFIFGAAQERRWNRLEKTLSEVAEGLRLRDAADAIKTEEFVALLESVAPAIGKSTAEVKRQFFRTLLLNAALTPERSIEWEEARLAAELIEKIEWPGLEILASLHVVKKKESDIAIVFDEPSFLALWPESAPSPIKRFQLSFGFTVTEEWTHRLQQLKVLSYTRPLRRPTAGGEAQVTPGFGDLKFTKLGDLLVKWSLTERGKNT